ncbi:MAG TPA: hypothetical protein PLM06_10695 [Anaerolineae bacterium]|nr:hypothetical protein [Anaerolineae bacterium]
MRVIGQAPSSSLWRTLLWLLGLGGLLAIGWLTFNGKQPFPDMGRPTASPPALPTLQIDMKFAQYNVLLEQRTRALEENVILTSAKDFLPAVARVGDEVVAVQLRLMEGPAVGLTPTGKWPLELRVQEGGTLLGMQRFYLQDPELVGGQAAVALDRVLAREGVLIARLQQVRLIFNGDDRGIYALQEGFAGPFLEAQGRSGGVIVGFDADPFWQQVAHFGGDLTAALADPVLDLGGLHYLEADAFDDPAIDRDLLLQAQRDTALGLLRALQAGTRPASEILDVERYACFLALIDLWGLPERASPLNLGFYLAPGGERLEPVSFASSFPPYPDERLSLAVTYDDPQIQIAYAQEAARVSTPAYLEELRAVFGEEFDAALWDRLAERQELIRRSLNPVRPVFAYLADPTPESYGVLRVGVANVTQLPAAILGFDIGGLTFMELDPAWQRDAQDERVAEADGVVLRAHDAGSRVHYVHFDIPLALVAAQAKLDPHGDFTLSVAVRVAGSSERVLVPARPGTPLPLQEDE